MRSLSTLLLFLLLVIPGCATTGPSRRAASHATRASPPLETGLASFYGARHTGAATASGAPHDPAALTAAHRTFPFGTQVRVTNLANDRSVVVTINDRGPFVRGRIIDVSKRAARELDFVREGTARVRLAVVSR